MKPLSVIKDLVLTRKKLCIGAQLIFCQPIYLVQSFKPFCESPCAHTIIEYFVAWPTVLGRP